MQLKQFMTLELVKNRTMITYDVYSFFIRRFTLKKCNSLDKKYAFVFCYISFFVKSVDRAFLIIIVYKIYHQNGDKDYLFYHKNADKE